MKVRLTVFCDSTINHSRTSHDTLLTEGQKIPIMHWNLLYEYTLLYTKCPMIMDLIGQKSMLSSKIPENTMNKCSNKLIVISVLFCTEYNTLFCNL